MKKEKLPQYFQCPATKIFQRCACILHVFYNESVYSIFSVLFIYLLLLLKEIIKRFTELIHEKICKQKFCTSAENRYSRATRSAHFYILVCQNTFNFKRPPYRKEVAHFQCSFCSCNFFWKCQLGCQFLGVKIDFVTCIEIIVFQQ